MQKSFLTVSLGCSKSVRDGECSEGKMNIVEKEIVILEQKCVPSTLDLQSFIEKWKEEGNS